MLFCLTVDKTSVLGVKPSLSRCFALSACWEELSLLVHGSETLTTLSPWRAFLVFSALERSQGPTPTTVQMEEVLHHLPHQPRFLAAAAPAHIPQSF